MNFDWQYECTGRRSPFGYLQSFWIVMTVFGIVSLLLWPFCVGVLAYPHNFYWTSVVMALFGLCISPALFSAAYDAHSIFNLVPGQAKKLWDETHTADDRACDLEIYNWLNVNLPTIIDRCKKLGRWTIN